MKQVILGAGIYILGFILVSLCSNFFAGNNVEHSYYYGIIFSILYLATIVGISTDLILKKVEKRLNT